MSLKSPQYPHRCADRRPPHWPSRPCRPQNVRTPRDQLTWGDAGADDIAVLVAQTVHREARLEDRHRIADALRRVERRFELGSTLRDAIGQRVHDHGEQVTRFGAGGYEALVLQSRAPHRRPTPARRKARERNGTLSGASWSLPSGAQATSTVSTGSGRPFSSRQRVNLGTASSVPVALAEAACLRPITVESNSRSLGTSRWRSHCPTSHSEVADGGVGGVPARAVGRRCTRPRSCRSPSRSPDSAC